MCAWWWRACRRSVFSNGVPAGVPIHTATIGAKLYILHGVPGRIWQELRRQETRDEKRATCPANRFVRSKHPAAVFSCLARIRLRYVPVRGLAVSTTLTPYLNQSVHRPSRPTPRQSQGRVYEDEEANHWQPVVTYCNRRNLHVAGLYSIWPFSVALIIPSS